MSLGITAVRLNAESIVKGILGTPFKELPYQFDVETNDSRNLASGFAVTWGPGTQTYEINQVVNLKQDLIVTITKRCFVRNDDDKITETLDTVYTSIGTILKRFICDRLDMMSTVQEIQLKVLGEPIRIGEGRDILSVRMVFEVRYLVI